MTNLCCAASKIPHFGIHFGIHFVNIIIMVHDEFAIKLVDVHCLMMKERRGVSVLRYTNCENLNDEREYRLPAG